MVALVPGSGEDADHDIPIWQTALSAAERSELRTPERKTSFRRRLWMG
jgi:hypothetical protein